MKIDPQAPAAAGHSALPLPEHPSPLTTAQPPHGLYATVPTPDTLARLSSGTLSPDGRFRSATTPDGGAWVARVDGAWLWEVQVPAPPPPKPPESPTPGGPVPPSPPPPPAPKVKGPLQWTPQSTLLFTDSNGTWQEANPATTLVTALPTAMQGTLGISFSPDNRQVLYYKGQQLFTALRDGSQPKLVGSSLTGHWGPDGKLVTVKASQPGTMPRVEAGASGRSKE